MTAPTTTPDLADTLARLCAQAKRAPHILGVTGPSKWDDAHAAINAALDGVG